MSTPEAANRHYSRQQRLTAAVLIAARQQWDQLGTGDFDTGWSRIGPRLTVLTVAGQRSAALDATAYVPSVLNELEINAPAVGRVNVAAFSGTASDGRSLESLLYEPVVRTRERLGQGTAMSEALDAGRSQLDMIVRTQMADAARVASHVGMVARPKVTRYVRMLNPPSCSRCSLLAGRVYRMEQAFQRHPSCDCRHIPATEDIAGDLTTDSQAYFDSLPEAEQNKIFTNAGAEAIREGADIGQVVNARRGMRQASGSAYTTEGTTKRGAAGRRLQGRPRLMPEAIFEAAPNRAAAIEGLRRHRYIL